MGHLAVSPEPLGMEGGVRGNRVRGESGSGQSHQAGQMGEALPGAECSFPGGPGGSTLGASSSRCVSKSLQLSPLRVLTTTSRQRRARGGTKSSHRSTSCQARLV